jgi:hypothetical protein
MMGDSVCGLLQRRRQDADSRRGFFLAGQMPVQSTTPLRFGAWAQSGGKDFSWLGLQFFEFYR